MCRFAILPPTMPLFLAVWSVDHQQQMRVRKADSQAFPTGSQSVYEHDPWGFGCCNAWF